MTGPPFILRSDGSKSYGTRVKAAEWAGTLAPCDLSYIRIDHQTRLQFGDTEVVIQSSFRVHEGGIDSQLDPGERGDLGPVLRIYPDALVSASIEADGTLRLVFARGAVIVVPPDPNYEPWQISGPGSALVVCEPGTTGDLSVWS